MARAKLGDPSSWILLILLNASKQYGVNLNEWFLTKKPEEMKADLTTFTKAIQELQNKGVITTPLLNPSNYCLTDQGRFEALRIKSSLPYIDYKKFFRNFPEIEVKERVSNIEHFLLSVTSIFLLLLATTLIKLTTLPMITAAIIVVCWFAAFIVLISFIIVYLIKMIIFYFDSISGDSFLRFRFRIWQNRNLLSWSIAILIIIAAIIITKAIFSSLTWIEIGYGIIIGIIASLIISIFQIKKMVSKFIVNPFNNKKVKKKI